ncbi:MAG TPA: ribose 5-phosphate isomerase B [Pyrinomonadaceae bacterium]|jgi:ribose 5-phosphate isomerase B|nr:ribose 5-phosphate isomerase B [Pyrinomonadaceae bacterium]
MADDSTRDRVRALVREVLAKAAPENADDKASSETPTRFVNTVSESNTQTAVTRDESAKSVITEDDVRGLERGAVLRIGEDARLTPLAADIISEKQIEIVRRTPRRGSKASKLIAVGADHGGFRMKEELKVLLTEMGHRVQDFGAYSEDAVDYPDFAHAVARAVAEGSSDLGIMIDGAGVGSAMTANKVPGVRAAACYSVDVARNSREHNDANVLTLGSKTIDSKQMRDIVTTWLSTEITEDRHRKRVAKIDAIQRQYQR